MLIRYFFKKKSSYKVKLHWISSTPSFLTSKLRVSRVRALLIAFQIQSNLDSDSLSSNQKQTITSRRRQLFQ